MEKRQREQARRRKQLDKQQRRVKRDADRKTNSGAPLDKDADLAGIVPGPQPGQIIETWQKSPPLQPSRSVQ